MEWIGLLEEALDNIESALDDKSIPQDLWDDINKVSCKLDSIIADAKEI